MSGQSNSNPASQVNSTANTGLSIAKPFLPNGAGANLATAAPWAIGGNLGGALLQGTVDPNHSGNSAGNIGGAALKGAGTGAAIGSIVPGVGTAIGGGVGGLLGALSTIL